MADAKQDLFKQHRDEYKATAKPRLITAGPARYLAVAGRGAPGGDAFQTAIGALYGMAYTIKMTRKMNGRGDHVVAKLEGRYGTDSGKPSPASPDGWSWELMIRTPVVVGEDDLADAREKLIARGKGDGVARVHLLELEEGRCVQMLHVGPYEKEEESLTLMRDFATAADLLPQGHHHEIYLSDPRRVAPEKLRTILRQPVRA